jgi:hypothetical protein
VEGTAEDAAEAGSGKGASDDQCRQRFQASRLQHVHVNDIR